MLHSRMAQLGLLKDVVPDDVRDEVSHGLYRLLYISTVFFNLGTDELHDCISTLLACFEEETRCHLVDQAAKRFHLALILLSLNRQDGLLKLVEEVLWSLDDV